MKYFAVLHIFAESSYAVCPGANGCRQNVGASYCRNRKLDSPPGLSITADINENRNILFSHNCQYS